MNEILTTQDYSIFKKLTGNREVKKRADGIIESIRKIGWVSNPIIVNKNMEVIDGQGRLEALMQLGMPVEYRIIDDLSLDHCRTMNTYNVSWTRKDYLDSYAFEGNENYERIKNLMNTFKMNDIRITLRACSVDIRKDGFMNGKLLVSANQFGLGYKRLSLFSKFESLLKRFSGKMTTKAYALFYIADHPEVDKDYLMEALKKCDPTMVYTDSVPHVLESFQREYNRGRLKKNRVHFYEDYMKENA